MQRLVLVENKYTGTGRLLRADSFLAAHVLCPCAVAGVAMQHEESRMSHTNQAKECLCHWIGRHSNVLYMVGLQQRHTDMLHSLSSLGFITSTHFNKHKITISATPFSIAQKLQTACQKKPHSAITSYQVQLWSPTCNIKPCVKQGY